jgi:2-oxoglutarate dehydrogenase E2 component (dihydrolipoamide succinyltransferase)
MGMFGSNWSMGGTPILNWPESALLLMGPVVDRPIVEEGQIVIRPMMPLVYTFDHRIIDGVPAVRFMMKLVELIKNPNLGLLK